MKHENITYTKENIIKVCKDFRDGLEMEVKSGNYGVFQTREYEGVITGVEFVITLLENETAFREAIDFLNGEHSNVALF